MQDKTFYISYEGPARDGERPVALAPFPLWVPSAEISPADLEKSVRDSLGLPETALLYFSRTGSRGGDGEAAEIVPLVAALPDGIALCAHVAAAAPASRHEAVAAPRDDAERSRGELSVASGGMVVRRRSHKSSRGVRGFWYERHIPSPEKLNTDLANERTLLAWLRTAISAMKIVFSWLTLTYLAPGWQAVDVVITLVLALVMLALFVVGWSRFMEVRDLLYGVESRRVSLRPVFVVLIAVFAITCAGVWTRVLLPKAQGGK
eukprot:TRINITY_DN29966_c0_g1_i1.p1 TRINITY_DN29966_c0_g1~~TRINITY_DN29966_c0_g1_i1.p1  ORF type:complete len:263 (+),score=62.27 TRINITY_DN29966_c0_g1_i1:92-880(+)